MSAIVIQNDEQEYAEAVLSEAKLEDLHQELVLVALAQFQTPQGCPYSEQLTEKLKTVN